MKISKRHLHIMVFLNLILVSILLICGFETQKALAAIEFILNTSPDKVNIGEKVVATIIAKNDGNGTLQITAIELYTP